MVNNIRISAGLLAAVLFLSGCAARGWPKAEGPVEMPGQNYEVRLPEGWRYVTKGSVLVGTRDGMALQKIRVVGLEIGGDETPLSYTKKKIQKGMLPQELAEIILDDLKSNPDILNLQVLENGPALVAGHPGIKLVYTYQTASDLTQASAGYGLIQGGWFYMIIYDAPARHYFERDLAAFEKTKASFRLTKD